MKSHFMWVSALCMVALGACRQAATSVPATDEPVAVIAEESSPTASAEPAATSTPLPTPTPEPTQPEDEEPDIAATVIALQEPRLYDSYESPDSQWRVDILIYDCVETAPDTQNALDQLILVDLADNTERVIDDQPQYCGGLGAFGLGGRFWSENSRYFYYTNAREGVPDGGFGAWDPPIFRLDVTDSSVETLGGGPLSPDGALLATWQGKDLAVWDVTTGEETPVLGLPPEQSPSTILWSPEGDSLVYLYWQLEAGSPIDGTSYVGFVDRETMMPELLLESQSPGFASIAWDDPDQLTLQDWDGQIWTYDFATGELGQ